MSTKQRNDDLKVNANEVLEALMLKRVIVFLNTTTSEGETHEYTGFLRGYSDKWLILQEDGREAQEAENLIIVYTNSIQFIRKALPMER